MVLTEMFIALKVSSDVVVAERAEALSDDPKSIMNGLVYRAPVSQRWNQVSILVETGLELMWCEGISICPSHKRYVDIKSVDFRNIPNDRDSTSPTN